MVNTEDFIKRIEIILEYYSLSASVFADKMGVQRSALSHLMSGRNKPSLDFVMKIVENFHEIDLYWLLNGTGSFPKKENDGHSFSSPSPSLPISINETAAPDLFSVEEQKPKQVQDLFTQETKAPVSVSTNDIERIVVFYTNGTFKSYTPGK